MAGRVKWNLKGFAELRNSPEVLRDLEARASRVAAAAGKGFEANDSRWAGPGSKGSRPRARTSVGTATMWARAKQAREGNTLQRALDAGR